MEAPRPIRTATTLFGKRPQWAHPTRREEEPHEDFEEDASEPQQEDRRKSPAKKQARAELSGHPTLLERDVGRVSGWVRRNFFGPGARRYEMRGRAVTVGVPEVQLPRGQTAVSCELPGSSLPTAMSRKWSLENATSALMAETTAASTAGTNPQTFVVCSVSVSVTRGSSVKAPAAQRKSRGGTAGPVVLNVSVAPVDGAGVVAPDVAWNALAARKAAIAEQNARNATEAGCSTAAVPVASIPLPEQSAEHPEVCITRSVRAFVPFTPGVTAGIAVHFAVASPLASDVSLSVTLVGHVTNSDLVGHTMDAPASSCVQPWTQIDSARPSDVACVAAQAAARVAERDRLFSTQETEAQKTKESAAAAVASAGRAEQQLPAAAAAAAAPIVVADSDDDDAPEAEFIQVPGGDDES